MLKIEVLSHIPEQPHLLSIAKPLPLHPGDTQVLLLTQGQPNKRQCLLKIFTGVKQVYSNSLSLASPPSPPILSNGTVSQAGKAPTDVIPSVSLDSSTAELQLSVLSAF